MAADVSNWLSSDGETAASLGAGNSTDNLLNMDQSLAFASDRFNMTMDSIENSDPKTCNILTSEVAENRLAQLNNSYDYGLVCQHLALPGLQLKDVQVLASFAFIKHLDLSYNSLIDLSVLDYLTSLVSLNVSHNNLTKLLNFKASHSLSFVDYSYNEIEEIPDLSSVESISVLNLDGNQITELTGLSNLQLLTTLSVADNRLETIQGIDDLSLNNLNLAGNSISTIDNIGTLKLLQVINLSGNQVYSLKGLCGLAFLRDINLEDNQIVDLPEVRHLKDLPALDNLNLKRNPLQALSDYKHTVINQLTSLSRLDGQLVPVEERVSASNRISFPIEMEVGFRHLQLMSKAARRPARLNFSTLTHVDEPYPMLILCGPSGSAKSLYVHSLVQEFPSFFGLGVSHTTRPQGSKESHGRDYYFINETTFNRASESGEFIQLCQIGDYWYGLTMAAIEQVAQQGLACVTHMTLEGVLALKRCHFDPRYILALPLSTKVYEERLHTKAYLGDTDVTKMLTEINRYKEFHQNNPGFFDATINTDNLQEGYNILQSIVMAYGGISPETPLTLSLSVSRPTTQQSSLSDSTDTELQSAINSGIFNNAGCVANAAVTPSSSAPVVPILARPWSRPSSSSSNHHPPPLIKKSISDQVSSGLHFSSSVCGGGEVIKTQISAR